MKRRASPNNWSRALFSIQVAQPDATRTPCSVTPDSWDGSP